MKLALLAYGTRGDVQPMLALAFALQARGHEVRLIAPKNMSSWVARAGVPFAPLPLDVQALLRDAAAQRMLARGDIQSFFKWLAKIEKDFAREMEQALIAGTQDVDAIVTHVLLADRAAAIGAARGIPVLLKLFFPVLPSREFASPFIAQRSLGILNPLTHRLLIGMLWKGQRDDIARLRRELGAAPVHDSFVSAVHRDACTSVLAYSPSIFPRPSDYAACHRVVGGVLMPDALHERLAERGLPEDLARWLDAGPPPVFLGFGSMPVLDVPAMLSMARKALSAVGARAVVGAGWSEIASGGDEQLFAVSEVDHQALLPRCSAAVHHGGAGTTYASLHAGAPTLICSVFADQPFWGRRCQQLGVGSTFAFKHMSAASLERGLREVLDSKVRERAQQLSKQLGAEDGLNASIDVIERELPSMRPPL